MDTIASAQMDLPLLPSRPEMEQAVARKDTSYDGVFFVAVRTTGIFCRPSCPARSKPENNEFFFSIREAVFAGYRPCKRCRPIEVYGAQPEWVVALMQKLEASPDAKLTSADLRELGVSPERARRWFREHYGMTFVEWCRGRRLADAFTQLRQGSPIDDAVLDHGYSSHSGFREAFHKTFGVPPGQSDSKEYIATQMLETPLGPLLVAAVGDGICLVEYSDRRMLEHNYATMQKQFGRPILPVTNAAIEQLRDELTRYFAGSLTEFTVPLAPHGTPFQEKVKPFPTISWRSGLGNRRRCEPWPVPMA
jgi:AraC family transcriptional regulator, regulatory protein of adaptative response / methylated-DNA-[protein]-cysteine methyltransferase